MASWLVARLPGGEMTGYRSNYCALKQRMIVFEQAVCPDRVP